MRPGVAGGPPLPAHGQGYGQGGYGNGYGQPMAVPAPAPPPVVASGYEQFAPPLPPGVAMGYGVPQAGGGGGGGLYGPRQQGYAQGGYGGQHQAGYGVGGQAAGGYERRDSLPTSLAPSLPPIQSSYTHAQPGPSTYQQQPSAQPISSYTSDPAHQPSQGRTTTYQPSPYPPDRDRNRVVSAPGTSVNQVAGGAGSAGSVGRINPYALPGSQGGVGSALQQQGGRHSSGSNYSGVNQNQAYRDRAQEVSRGLDSPSSLYEERFDGGQQGQSRPNSGMARSTPPLSLRQRPESGQSSRSQERVQGTATGGSGAEAGRRGETFYGDLLEDDDELPPPPEYSQSDPSINRLSGADGTSSIRSGVSAGSRASGAPTLPDIVADTKGMRLFDDDNEFNLNSRGTSMDTGRAAGRPAGGAGGARDTGNWDFLAGEFLGNGSGTAPRNGTTSNTGGYASGGTRNVSGASASTVRDYFPDYRTIDTATPRASEIDGSIRGRMSAESSPGLNGPGLGGALSPLSPGGGSYEDEMRDRVHPVVRHSHDQFSRHRRQASDASIVSVSTIQSGYGGNGRNSQTYLPGLDGSARGYAERGSPVMSSPATYPGNAGEFPSIHRLSGRPSSESIQSGPYPLQRSSITSNPEHRSTSFSGQSSQRDAAVTTLRTGSLGHTKHSAAGYVYASPSNSVSNVSIHPKQPSQRRITAHAPIYPALLSRVAEVFRLYLQVGDRFKDGLSYKDAFDGRDAVDLLCEIIRTTDRNLALLLGRALDNQRFFHDVTYAHRLRDSSNEIYRFKQLLPSTFTGPEGMHTDGRPSTRPSSAQNSKGHSSSSVSAMTSISSGANSPSMTPDGTPATSTTTVNQMPDGGKARPLSGASTSSSEDALPVGVFTLLTDCYSPTCSRDQLCYSINCPRRLEQQKRLNIKIQPGLNQEITEESLIDAKETGTLWIQSVPQDILDKTDDTEKKRQEAINELIYTERDFVRDLEYLRDSWIKPLRTLDVVPQAKREEFVQQVFWNSHEILGVNQILAERLTKRQKAGHIVPHISDIFLELVPKFDPFVTYGAHQLFGKYEFEKEKGNNPAFQKFVDDTERDPASRKLELNGYLTKPTTRLARYPLLLEVICKYTPDDNRDKKELPEVIKMVRAFLSRVNEESGKSENLFNLAQLDQQLIFRPGENFDLHLRDKSRELIYKGPLKTRGGPNGENADLLVFLFDHALLMVKPKWVNKHEQYKVYRKPIPLELLVVTSPEDGTKGSLSRGKNTVGRANSGKTGKEIIPKPESKHGYSLTMIHLGRKGYNMTLWVPTYAGRKKWLEHIDTQQQILRDRSRVFETATLSEKLFMGANKLNCAVPYDHGHRMIYGTDNGVWFSNFLDERLRVPAKVLNLTDVTQVDVIEDYQLLIVLAERGVTSYPLDSLDPTDPTNALKKGKRLSSHTSFFKSGVCLGKTLLCIVKSSSLSSTIKTLEPVNPAQGGKKQPASFRKLLNNSNEPFKVFKEFYIPTESSSLSFLKTKLCVATTRGFEVVDLETLDTQGLLDPSDHTLDFVSKRENVRPIAIYRVEENFLLCYAEFAFYVNKTGWRAKPRWAIQWEGYPNSFAMHYPFILAFEPTFVEIRNVETGNLVQIITGNNIRCMFSDVPPSQIHAPNQYRPGVVGPYGYGQQQPFQQPGHPYPSMPMPPGRSPPRTQIIFVSDDGNVQVLRLSRERAAAMQGGPQRMPTNGGSIGRRG